MRALCLFMMTLALQLPLSAQTNPQSATTSGSSVAVAHTLLERGDATDAIAMLEMLQKQTPKPPGISHELGLAYYRNGKLVEAEKAFAAAMLEDPTDEESVQLRGLTLYRLGHPAEAIPYLEKIRKWTPNGDADADYVLGLCYMNSQRFDEARAAFATQYGFAPDSGAAWLLMGDMLLRANFAEMALQSGQEALAATPNLALAHFLMGEVYLYKQNPQKALAEFNLERHINPAYAPVYDRLGDVYLQLGDLQQAQASLTRALSLDLSSTGPFIQMGKVFLKKDDPQTAAMYLEHAAKMDPGNSLIHMLLGQAYRGLGKKDEARQQFESAARISANSRPTLESIQ